VGKTHNQMNKKSILIAASLGFVQLIISQSANAQDSLQLKDVVITPPKTIRSNRKQERWLPSLVKKF
jgi:vitamin B12 transporter